MTKRSPASSPAKDSGAARKGKPVGAVVNASQILRFLQAARGPVTATQITRQLGLNPSTCFNILGTLVDEDFVDFDEDGKTYTLSLGVIPLARSALEQSAGLRALQPRLQEFALKYRVLVGVSRRSSRERSMMVAVAESDAPIRIHGRIGATSPLLLGATGRVFAAYSELRDDEMRERFRELRLARLLDFDTFKAQVAEVRQTGWAIDDGYYLPGTVSVAAPMRDADGAVTLCCSAIMFNGQYDPKRIATIAMELVAICDSVSEATSLGGTHERPVTQPTDTFDNARTAAPVARAKRSRAKAARSAEVPAG